MTKFTLLPFFFLFAISTLFAEPKDLNELIQDFVIETKQLHVPGYPEAFNPSIIRWRNRLIMSFRSYDPITRSSDMMGLAWLDEEFNVVGKPRIIIREGETCIDPSRAQDPRLLVENGELLIIYSNSFPYEKPESRMYVGKIREGDDGEFTIIAPCPLIHFDKEIRTRKEKNWAPFIHNNTLLLSYSLQPHYILIPKLHNHSCLSLTSTIGKIKWDWGVMRGGTPAHLVDGRYLAFFHSDKALSSVQSEGKVMNHYFMGAYTFEPEFPFNVSAVGRHPIMSKNFYEGPMYKTWKPLRVVFPCGYIFDEKFIWVSYGRQDHEAWIVKLDKEKLFQSLLPVETVQPEFTH